MPPPPPSPSSIAAAIDAPEVAAVVAAAVGAAFAMFKGAKRLAPQAPPPTLSPRWKAEEKARSLACERSACPERPVVLNPMRQNVV